MITSQSRGAVVATASALLVTMAGTTVPTPLYSIYAGRLGFTGLTVTLLFAVYAIGVVAALTAFGRLSDEIGRKPVLLAALACAGVSAVLFLLPQSLPMLFAARIVSGLSAGLMSGAATAAIVDLFPAERRAVGGALAVGVNTGGLAAGTLIAGIAADLSSAPLVVPFAVHLGFSILAYCAVWRFAPAPVDAGPLRIRPRKLRVPSSIRGAFVRAVLAGESAFAVAGVLTAVSALFLAQHIGLSSHALAGFVVCLVFAGMAVGQIAARRFAPRPAMAVGCGGLAVGAAILGIALGAVSLTALILAAVVSGVSGGLCVNAGLATTVEAVEPARRGEVSSSYFAGLYLMLAVPAIGVGALSAGVGLQTSGLVFACVVALVSAVVGLVEAVSVKRSSPVFEAVG
ncbi:MFS transporter [Gordonia malaquae]|uniref:MFS transporter n=1 Tax=Gordonia malaquae TaxID=410332 RepID=UPI0030C79D00